MEESLDMRLNYLEESSPPPLPLCVSSRSPQSTRVTVPSDHSSLLSPSLPGPFPLD